MRASSGATPVYLTARARELRAGQTEAERILWSDLRARRLNGYRFVRQLALKPYIADFACRTHGLVVELDGSQHAGSAYDHHRSRHLNALGWSVLRFWNDDVLRRRSEALETILAALERRLPAQDGAGLRFFPASAAAGKPSPGSLREPPSPEAGEGVAPFHEAMAQELLPSPVPGEGPGRGMRASKGSAEGPAMTAAAPVAGSAAAAEQRA